MSRRAASQQAAQRLENPLTDRACNVCKRAGNGTKPANVQSLPNAYDRIESSC